VRPVARVRPTIGAEGGDVVRVRAFSVLVVGVGLLGVLLLASLTQAVAASGPSPAAPGPTCPTFNSSNFDSPTSITNPYFPLTPGDLYTYSG
jgi:hypothetical protein